MKSFLGLLFLSTLLACVACGSSANPTSDTGGNSAQTTVPTAAKTPFPTQAPTLEPTATKTAAPTSTQLTDPTPTATVVPNTIAEAAKRTNPGVPIVKRGDLGAQAKEKITVQLAIDSMMVGNLLTSVTPNNNADYIRAEGVAATDTDFGGGQTLVGYTREAFTHYCYTWDSNGTIKTQLEPGTPPCEATP